MEDIKTKTKLTVDQVDACIDDIVKKMQAEDEQSPQEEAGVAPRKCGLWLRLKSMFCK